MTKFLFLTRMIANEPHPVVINSSHIVAIHPAVYFDHCGKADFRDGTHIWTTLETPIESCSPWLVSEDFMTVASEVRDVAV